MWWFKPYHLSYERAMIQQTYLSALNDRTFSRVSLSMSWANFSHLLSDTSHFLLCCFGWAACHFLPLVSTRVGNLFLRGHVDMCSLSIFFIPAQDSSLSLSSLLSSTLLSQCLPWDWISLGAFYLLESVIPVPTTGSVSCDVAGSTILSTVPCLARK